ncbi:hypothetical protein GCM10009596_21590 [Arthrobacter rhombi]|uniref:SdpI family protein n=1 Tax=Arthrobacter rhombi TaxID=71253 RepID=UPI0031DC2271
MGTAFGPAWLAIVSAVFTLLLLCLGIVCQLAAHGRLAPNSLLGLRTPRLKSSDARWRAGHAAALPISWCGFGLAATCLLVGLAVPLARLGAVAVFAATVATSFVLATRAAATAP